MRKVKVGIVGCGVISHTYIKYSVDVQWLDITACSALHIENAKRTAERYGIPKACSTEELLADPEIEIVINLTIPAIHTEINKQILNAESICIRRNPSP